MFKGQHRLLTYIFGDAKLTEVKVFMIIIWMLRLFDFVSVEYMFILIKHCFIMNIYLYYLYYLLLSLYKSYKY